MTEKTVLHVGCGPRYDEALHEIFRKPGWKEIRLDINPDVGPDIIGTMTDLSMVDDGTVDAIWSSHNLEHLFYHEVDIALREFFRVLKPDGFALITLPDLKQVAQLIVEDKLEDVAYESPAGPISPIDTMYGLRSAIAGGNTFMAHKTGFTQKTLVEALARAGFVDGSVWPDDAFNLWAEAHKQPIQKEAGAQAK